MTIVIIVVPKEFYTYVLPKSENEINPSPGIPLSVSPSVRVWRFLPPSNTHAHQSNVRGRVSDAHLSI